MVVGTGVSLPLHAPFIAPINAFMKVKSLLDGLITGEEIGGEDMMGEERDRVGVDSGPSLES